MRTDKIKYDDKLIDVEFCENQMINVSASESIINKITSDVDYKTNVFNKPSINNIVLIDNKTSEDLGLEPTINDITEQDIDKIIYGG